MSGVPQEETRHVVVEGQRRLFLVRDTPLGLNGALVGVGLDVSEHDELRSELVRRAESEAAVLESLATPVEIYGRDKRLKFANRAFSNLWRLYESWLASRPTQGEVLDAMRRNRTLSEQAGFPAFAAARLRLFTDLIDPMEELLHLPDGTTLRMVVTPHPDAGLLYFYQDVSDRLELERARNLLIAVQRATLDNLAEAVAVFGSDGRLKLWNPRYARMWQLDAGFLASQPHIGDVIERSRALLDTGGDWLAQKEILTISAIERVSGASRRERPDGVVLDHVWVPLPDGGTLSTYVDVTDSTRIERALRERNEVLLAAEELKAHFLASVSYELRTPLSTVIGFSEMLSRQYFGPLNEEQHEYTQGIISASHQLLHHIDYILDLASIEAGRIELHPEPFVVETMLAGALDAVGPAARRKGIALQLDGVDGLGEVVADERRIRQALVELLSAVLRTTPGSGAVRLEARRDGGGVAFAVSGTVPPSVGAPYRPATP